MRKSNDNVTIVDRNGNKKVVSLRSWEIYVKTNKRLADGTYNGFSLVTEANTGMVAEIIAAKEAELVEKSAIPVTEIKPVEKKNPVASAEVGEKVTDEISGNVIENVTISNKEKETDIPTLEIKAEQKPKARKPKTK